MAKKQVKPAPSVAPPSVGGAKPAIAPIRAPRFSSSRHSKATVETPVAAESAAEKFAAEPIVAAEVIMAEVPVAASLENPHQAISKIAYGYFEARGYHHGNPADDWFRAEREYYGRR